MSAVIMATDVVAPTRSGGLLVAWQHPETREYALVARLQLPTEADPSFRFGYLPSAERIEGFRPFVEFPQLDQIYESDRLFPLFENRMTARERSDFPVVAGAVGLGPDADPFEVLVRTAGRRATDALEIVAEPLVDSRAHTVRTQFLVHGVRYLEIEEALGRLRPGDRLRLLWDAQNPKDRMAITVADTTTHNLGWVPRYLCPLVHRSASRFGWPQIELRVVHVGDPSAPPHLRLLCELVATWDEADSILDPIPDPLMAQSDFLVP